MKRRFKLIKKILEYVEVTKKNGDRIPLPEFSDYKDCVVAYHVKLCHQAGFLDVRYLNQNKGNPVDIVEMTWAGHNELDRLRTEEFD